MNILNSIIGKRVIGLGIDLVKNKLLLQTSYESKYCATYGWVQEHECPQGAMARVYSEATGITTLMADWKFIHYEDVYAGHECWFFTTGVNSDEYKAPAFDSQTHLVEYDSYKSKRFCNDFEDNLQYLIPMALRFLTQPMVRYSPIPKHLHSFGEMGTRMQLAAKGD